MKITKASLFLAALVALGIASPINSAAAPNCVTGAHIIVARGSRLPQDNNGSLAEMVMRIKAQVPNSDNTSTVYPASVTNPAYPISVQDGVKDTRNQITAYVAKCGAGSKIVLVGFSQGATVMTDTLVGAATGSSMLDPKYSNNIAAVAVFGDPTFVAGQTYDVGGARNSGDTRRDNAGDLEKYWSTKFRSYCTPGDEFCDSAGAKGKYIHNQEVHTWAQNATSFIVPLVLK